MEYDRLFRWYREKGIDYMVEWILESEEQSFPHRTCYLIDITPLKEDVLSCSELDTIIATSARRFLQKSFEKSRINPVSLESAPPKAPSIPLDLNVRIRSARR